ncbi:hypothetical protein L917_17426, partial [Phytophthora nicotianae]
RSMPGAQKSEQRPLRSQSPNLVGSLSLPPRVGPPYSAPDGPITTVSSASSSSKSSKSSKSLLTGAAGVFVMCGLPLGCSATKFASPEPPEKRRIWAVALDTVTVVGIDASARLEPAAKHTTRRSNIIIRGICSE